MEKFLTRSLGELDLPVIMLDGTAMGEHVLVVAMGIDAKGHKHVLGVTHGSTESEQVCGGLLRQLLERGLVVERARLFVIDGGKGARKAIRVVFGQSALLEAQKKFRRVKGYREMPQLIAALEATIKCEGLDNKQGSRRT